MPLISVEIIAGFFTMALMNFSTVRKNMQIQSEQQIHSRMDARLKLESTDTFSNMAKEGPVFAERFTAVDSAQEYYIIVAFLDLFESYFALTKEI
jgi:hypothetical protein